MTTRRELLAAGAAAGVAGIGLARLPGFPAPGQTDTALQAATQPPADRLSFLVDSRLPPAQQLATRARLMGHDVHDPHGEIIATLLARPQLLTDGRHLVGLASYSDFMLAADLLRQLRHPVRHALSLSHGATMAPLVDGGTAAAALLAAIWPAPTAPASLPRCTGATSFLWLA